MVPEKEIGISLQGYIPVRRDPAERSEMTSQILFGESVEILDDEGNWLYVRNTFDGYEGWIDAKCIIRLENESIGKGWILARNARIAVENKNHLTQVPAGSIIPMRADGKPGLGKRIFDIPKGELLNEAGRYSLEALIPGIIGVPYIWGGRSGFGFDCSGLTQYLARALGARLPRDANEQAATGKTLSFMNETLPGDLAFFDDVEGLIHHVGMITVQGTIIHASGKVRIDRIDQQGIYNVETGEYSHKLRVLKRIL